MGYADSTRPIALAHRGGGGMAPENTLAAFALTTDLGFRYLESDLRLTADGRLVCFHDATVDRVTEGHGPVSALTLEELRRLRVDGRETIPTLDEALEAFPDTYFSVDLKDQAAIGPLVRTLRRRGVAERLCIAGAWDRWLADVRAEVPAVATTLGWQSLTVLLMCARAGVRPPRYIATAPFAHVPVRLGGLRIHVDRVVDMAHHLGVRVVTWTVDDAATMHDLLDLGVDAVITDRPDVLRSVFIQRDLWEPMTSPHPTPAAPNPTGAAMTAESPQGA